MRLRHPSLLAGLALALAPLSEALARSSCPGGADPAAEAVSIRGSVTATPDGAAPLALGLGDVVCPGDRIATGPSSSVELRFSGADTTTGAAANTTIAIPAAGTSDADVSVIQGLLRFVSSTRRRFSFETSVVNAGIDGTEALIAVDGPQADSLVLVREGRLTVFELRQPSNRLQLAGGNAAYASRQIALVEATPDNVPPVFRPLLLNPEGAADWAVYYPPVLLASGVAAPEVLAAAEALSAGEPVRAEALLDGLALGPRDEAAALSVRAVAAVFRNDRAAGLALSQAAVEIDPGLGAAHIAQSYALQAAGDVDAARRAADRATTVAPDDAYAWARRAELDLTVGAYGAAEAAVQRSLGLRETALARTVQGFRALAAVRLNAAERWLRRATELDSEAPLPRLGLGLAKVRRGDLAEGRGEIENAVALDPRRAQLRTWLGRVYFEEGLPEKARAQFEIASEEDPDDANTYLFAAIERFAANDPVGALDLVQEAEDAAGGRGTIRGAEGLAEDRSVRGAALARVYDTLGFRGLATVTGTAASELAPGNPESHYFLADAYLGRQGFEIAQSSERLLGQILSPPNRRLIQPRLAEADLGLLTTNGPARATFAEFAPLVTGNGLSFGASGQVGTQETFGAESSAAVLHGPVSLAVGQFYSSTDGFTTNNDVSQQVLSAEGRAQIGTDLTLFTELRYRNTDQGDRRLRFGPTAFPNLRQGFNRTSIRGALNYKPAPNHDIIATATYADRSDTVRDCNVDEFDPFVSINAEFDSEAEGIDGQLRYLGRFGQTRVTAGGSVSSTDVNVRDSFFFTPTDFGGCAPGTPPLFGFAEDSKDTVNFQGGYAYATTTALPWVEATVGLSVDSFDGIDTNTTEVNPKAGLRITPTDWLEVRGAYARTLKRPLILDQTIEPTTIAGFNQFYDDVNGSVANLAGVGVDLKPLRNLWVGTEAVWRWIDTPSRSLDISGNSILETLETNETTVSGYANAILGPNWALSAEVRYNKFEFDGLNPSLPNNVSTTSVPISLRWFGDQGLFASAGGAYVYQSVDAAPGEPEGDDQGFLLGASLGYRLPLNRGIIAIEGQNLLDQDLAFQDQAFITPRAQGLPFARERSVFLTATFAFGVPGIP